MRPSPRLEFIVIDDPADPRLEDYWHIRDRDLKGESGRPGLFIGEQAKTVARMLSIPGMTKSILTTGSHVDEISRAAEAPSHPPAAAPVPVFVVSPAAIEQVAGFPIHRGVLAVGYRPPASQLTLDHIVPRGRAPLTLLLCEDITNIDNMGLLFRNAAAFGVDAVILSPRCHDPLYRKCVRVSIGHVLSTPWARSTDWPGDLQRLQREWGVTLVAAATGDGAAPLDAIDVPDRVGLLVGSEESGLCPATIAACDRIARIPMAPGVDSLNVGVAAAVCLHRFSRGVRI